jgi:hypothetical protein
LRPTGIRPTFADMFALAGIDMPIEVFNPNIAQQWSA